MRDHEVTPGSVVGIFAVMGAIALWRHTPEFHASDAIGLACLAILLLLLLRRKRDAAPGQKPLERLAFAFGKSLRRVRGR